MRRRKLGKELAQLLTQHEVRPDLFVGFGVQIRQVYRIAYFAREQISSNDFGDFHAAFFLSFLRAGAQVRRQADAWMLPERVFGGQWFGGIDVESGGGYLARI